MLDTDRRKSIDLLVEHFWKNGYLSISRKFGRYLPEPEKIGNFEIDVVARYKKDYAIGITVSREDVRDSHFLEKITFLATRQTKFSNKKVLLFVGVPADLFKTVKSLFDNIDTEARSSIRLFRITENASITTKNTRKRNNIFS